MIARFRVVLFASVPLLSASAEDHAAGEGDRFAFFERRIRPILVEHCYECHSAQSDKPEGGLRLDTREGLLAGGDSGPAVAPGDPAGSTIIAALRHESQEMPPDRRLPDAIVEDFVRWIESGAPDPRDASTVAPSPHSAAVDVEAAKGRWPFTRPVEILPGPVEDGAWPDDPIDAYVLVRVEKEGLRRAPDAPRRVLARRLFFDLVGLPPTPEEIDGFAADPSPDAVGRLVDRLLASPRLGERWGRHWLDVARYADSSGGGRAALFPNAWRYRDYVVDAFNRDLPYDRFLEEQIAGDLLPTDDWRERSRRLCALGFLAVGPKNLDAQDKELLRMDVVDEQLDAIGQAVLGLTLGCARCHDHKFDPIPTRDYYALAGILRSTKTLLPGNVSGFVETRLPLEPALEEKLAAHDAELKRVQSRVAELRRRAEASRAEFLAAGVLVDDEEATAEGGWLKSTSVPGYVGKGYRHDADEGKGRKSMTFAATLEAPGTYEVRISYRHGENRSASVPVEIRGPASIAVVRVDQKRPPSLAGLFEPLGRYWFDAGQASVVVGNADAPGHVVADAVQFAPMGGSEDEEALRGRLERAAEDARALAESDAELKRLQRAAPPKPPSAMAVREEEVVEDCPILIRGNVHSTGETVPRGFLAATSPPSDLVVPPDQSGRVELARWLASRENPLTARVMVNRIWRGLFGRGIVATPDNFGVRGAPPSHPELLDALAVDFMEREWSIKRAVRRMAESRTYRLSTQAESAARGTDPDNVLLARHVRRRLDVEGLRDSMSALAGSLDLAYGGPAAPEGLASEFDYCFDDRRRSVYLPVFRANLYEMFDAFDFADPNIVVGARTRTTLPTQALFWMNSPFAGEQAAGTARRLLALTDLDDRRRVRRMFEEVLGRPPYDDELRRVEEELSAAPADPDERLRVWTEWVRALFASIDFRYNS